MPQRRRFALLKQTTGLDSLVDVVLTAPITTGSVLQYNGTVWANVDLTTFLNGSSHQLLGSLQGGTTTERYHLSATQAANLAPAGLHMLVDGGGTGEDGSPGPAGLPGAQGLQGQVGPAGPAVYLEAEQGEQGEMGVPGGQGPAGVGNTGPTGNPGPMGPAIYLDAETIEGDMGPPGIVGPTGPAGVTGYSAGILGLWRTDTTVGGDPATGRLRWDNATEINAANITIDHIDQNNNDIDIFFDLMTVGDRLYIQDQNDSANYQVWMINGTPTGSHALTYHSLPVVLVTSAGTGTTNFPNNSLVFVATTRPGSVGLQGPPGFAQDGEDGEDGWPGPPGPTGPVAPQSGCSVSRVANQTLTTAGTEYFISWDTEILDSENYFDVGAPTRITIPTSGWYAVTATVFTGATGNDAWLLRFAKNGAALNNTEFKTRLGLSTTVVSYPQITEINNYTAGDYLELGVTCRSGASNLVNARMGIVRVSGGGATGATGPTGPALAMLAMDGDDGDRGFPGLPGRDGANGNTGAQGPMGPAVYLDAEPGQDGDFIPGPTGPTGAVGPTGPAGGGGSSMGPPGQDGADSDDSGWLMGLRDPGATHWADEETIRKKWFFSARAEVNNGSAALPSLKFAVADTGFYAGGASNVGLAFSGVMSYEFTGTAFVAHTGEMRANSATTFNAVMRAGANDQNLAVIFGLTYDGTINPYIRGYGGTSATTPGIVQHVTPLTGNTITFQNAVDGLQFRVGGTNTAEIYRFGAWEQVAGDPPISSYNPGTITIPTEKFAIYADQFKATTTAVVTLQGTAVLRMI